MSSQASAEHDTSTSLESAASAVMGCGQYGVSNTAGPFAIEVPAGAYDVAVQTHVRRGEHASSGNVEVVVVLTIGLVTGETEVENFG
jgi:hypothetical protein